MIKKITSINNIQLPKKIKKAKWNKLKEQQPDTFERSTTKDSVKNTKQSYPSDCDNLEFKYQKIEFFPEDIEKMKTMTLKEENEYLSKLKAEGRYKVIKDTPEKKD